jgi:hypothetical protein
MFPSWDVSGVESAVDYSSYATGYKGLLNVELEKSYLLEQLTEAAAVKLLLPHLSGAPSEDLLKIRHEYESSLMDLHRSLYGLTSSDPAEGDRTLYELMQEVDENIRRLNEDMKRLKSRRWFDRAKLVLVAFPMILTIAVPPELQEIVRSASAMIGSASLISYIDSLRGSTESRKDIERSPFYVPWLIQSGE